MFPQCCHNSISSLQLCQFTVDENLAWDFFSAAAASRDSENETLFSPCRAQLLSMELLWMMWRGGWSVMAVGGHILDGYSRTTQSKIEFAALGKTRERTPWEQTHPMKHIPNYLIVTHSHTQQSYLHEHDRWRSFLLVFVGFVCF